MIKLKTFYSWDDLRKHLKTHLPTLYGASRTSCVIPFEQIHLDHPQLHLGDLSQLPKEMKLSPEHHLCLSGAVTWQEARVYLRSQGRDIKTSPTEELALVTAGVATSATGERCFGYGGVRDQVISLEYFDGEGELKELKSEKLLIHHPALQNHSQELKDYHQSYRPYQNFKNAPFPRLERETDLMIGMEGQLGVIKSVILETAPMEERIYLFIWPPPWDEENEAHREIFDMIQNQRGPILSCELIDHHSLNCLKEEERPFPQKGDLIFIEVLEKHFEEIMEGFLKKLTKTSMNSIFQIPEEAFHRVRAAVPRRIQEQNVRQGVQKKGTDVQVSPSQFPLLLSTYRQMKEAGLRFGIPSLLFGHFGDAHLHFNFLLKNDKVQLRQADEIFEQFYQKVCQWRGSPFAEHGVGLLKQKFIGSFYGKSQQEVFPLLKNIFDPHQQFFPQGFLNFYSVEK